MKESKKVFTSVSLDREVIEKVDKQRRQRANKEGRDISRSSYLNELIIRGMNK